MKNRELELEVWTEILDYDFKSGMKSVQVVSISFSEKKIETWYYTGKTKLLGMEFNSINDKFIIDHYNFYDSGGVAFLLQGTTATAFSAGKLPSIDYELGMFIRPDGTGEMTFTHDAYPAYFVDIVKPKPRRRIFSYLHPNTKIMAQRDYQRMMEDTRNSGEKRPIVPPLFLLSLPHVFSLLSDKYQIKRKVKF
ncbi:MAG: hypothetical protein QNJ15_04930 [Erythrobacter sp.]|nr:hypothetical protein [Erythrobacter sp.]